MRAQEATPLLLALAAGRRRRRRDDEQQEQQSSSSLAAATPPRAAQRRSQSPSLAVIHEVGPVHERNSSSSFSYSTPDMYENYNTLSTQVVWPPEGISWPPQGGQFSLTSSSSSSSSSAASFDIEDSGDAIFRAPSRSSRQLRLIQLLLICTAMVSIPFVAFVSIITPKEHFNSPLDHNNKGRSRDDHTYSYSQRHHRHFHRIVEKSYLTVVNQTDNSSDAAFDINTIPTNISFGELASLMVPIYFQSTVDLCVATIAPSNNNSSDGRNYPTAVMPDEVFDLRKKILKTRDLFDVFAPVYPRKLRLLGHEKKGDDEKKVNMLGGEGGKGKFRSQSEEVLHKMRMNHHTVVDVWKILRRFLDDGYMLIGDFQDLSHAKVKYTPERLQIYQLQVWNWKEEFVAFVAQNHEGIVEYLSHACPDKTEKQEQELTLANIKASSQSRRKGVANKKEKTPSCSFSRSKSSHLFWGRTPSSQLPDGNTDEASTVLAQLGSAQLNRALAYLSPALAAEHVVEDQALNKDVHDLYHNLRKEIRSFLDSVDLFGQLLFPDKSVGQHNEDVSLLKQTKQLLGDLNDEVVAYSKYVEWNEYPEEQVQLESFISADWADFRRWAQEVDLSGKLHSLADAMGNAKNEGPFLPSPESLASYLIKQKKNPSRDLVIGNEAGDADSIVSAICLAFLENKTPIISISLDTFLHERPEVEMLLNLAGVFNASENLLFIEDLESILDSSKDDEVQRLTLVDQNTINPSLHKFRHLLNVVEIVDHHTDENLYRDTCSGEQRVIAFESGKASVASTATLVAEVLLKQTNNPPPSLSTLLIGVILLDSVNLDESIGKVTSRDRDAVSHLSSQTDWDSSALRAYLRPSDDKLVIDTNQLFSHLERAKYSPEFWESFSVERALEYDYKEFLYGGENAEQRFGVSTILMPGAQFMEKEGFLSKTAGFMRSKEVKFLGIMFTFYDLTTGDFRRQLTFCSSGYKLREIRDDLFDSKMYKELDLKEVVSHQRNSEEIQVQLYEQKNVVYSRKQIGPMLVDFFASRLNNSDSPGAYGG